MCTIRKTFGFALLSVPVISLRVPNTYPKSRLSDETPQKKDRGSRLDTFSQAISSGVAWLCIRETIITVPYRVGLTLRGLTVQCPFQ